MTSKEIRARVKKIKNVQGDPEYAHSEESGLYEEFVTYVVNSESTPPDLAEKAKLVLRTKNIDFPRWIA